VFLVLERLGVRDAIRLLAEIFNGLDHPSNLDWVDGSFSGWKALDESVPQLIPVRRRM
jgi:hypothetical protein